MRIIRLQPQHARPYRALMLDAYQRHPDAFTSSAAERSALPLSWWQERLDPDASASEVVFGAMAQDDIAGVAGLSWETREKTRHKSTLFGMYVAHTCRRQGIARQLVDAVLRHAASMPQISVVQLTVTAGNASALHLYETCGFQPYGTEPLAVRVGAEYFAKIHMWCGI